MGLGKMAKKQWGKFTGNVNRVYAGSPHMQPQSVAPPAQQQTNIRQSLLDAGASQSSQAPPRYVPKNEEFEELKPEHDPILFAAMQSGEQVIREIAYDEYNRDYPLLIIDGNGEIRRVSENRIHGNVIRELSQKKQV